MGLAIAIREHAVEDEGGPARPEDSLCVSEAPDRLAVSAGRQVCRVRGETRIDRGKNQERRGCRNDQHRCALSCISEESVVGIHVHAFHSTQTPVRVCTLG